MTRVRHLRDYREQRRPANPEVGDQLDVLWKWVAAQPDLPPEVTAMLDVLAAVKKRLPKP